jgi:hypothetical protein
MKLLSFLLLAVPLLAQDTPATQAAPVTTTDQSASASPAPGTEPSITGSVDIGYRWVGVGGSFNTYRSVIDLGSGPKLLGVDLVFLDPTKRFFDRATLRMNNWGGDPYNTAALDVTKHRLYDFSFDYRNIAYYNFLPSYADPTAAQGIFFTQSAFDTRRRSLNTELDLFPGTRIVPYLSYMRDWDSGTGITDFVNGPNNEYPVNNLVRDKTDNFRGGVRIEMNKWHLTLEQGGTTFKDDQQVYLDQSTTGGRTAPYLGQTLDLSSLQQAYGIRGDSIYSKALFSASPVPWANLYGQFLYSRPESSVNYIQNNAGNFVSQNPLFFYTAESDLLSSSATQPHTSGSFGFELRPLKRLRIVESWTTDRYHNASSAFLTEELVLSAAATNSLSNLSNERLVYNYDSERIELFYDLTKKMTLRGGYEYLWGDAQVPAGLLDPFGGLESGVLRRNVGLAGFNFRPNQKIRVNVDFEGASGGRTYFSTSLQDYQKARVRASYQALTSLSLSATFSVLNNTNPAAGIDYAFLSRDNSVSALWNPGGGKRITVLADYSRSTLRSDIDFLVPQTFQAAQSDYRENAHTGTALVEASLPPVNKLAPKLACGGSFFVSSGSRPTRYYQPVARFTVPLHKYVQWAGEWRWYALTENFYLYEGFRSNQFTTSLRLLR